MSLLFTENKNKDECSVGYLLRISQNNGFKRISHLLVHAGFEWKNNRIPIQSILTGEFDLNPYLSNLGLEL